MEGVHFSDTVVPRITWGDILNALLLTEAVFQPLGKQEKQP